MVAMSRLDCDLLIVGSGFGGSVCALRGVEAGLRVVVLERGRRMDAAAYDDLADGKTNLFHRRSTPGLIELHRRRGLMAVTGSAVGGGSHLYTGVTVPAPGFGSSDCRHCPSHLAALPPDFVIQGRGGKTG